MGANDSISVVETAYRLDLDEAGWLEGLGRAAQRCLADVQGLVIYPFNLATWPVDSLDRAVFIDVEPEVQRAMCAVLEGAPREVLSINGPGYCDTVSTQFGARDQCHPRAYAFYRDHFAPGDGLGMVGANPDGTALCIGGFLAERGRLAPAFVRTWRRIMIHGAAGLRLRLAVDRDVIRNGSLTEAGEAVLETDGRLAHASGAAEPKTAREALRAAARSVDRARGKLRETDADEALDIWKGLTVGRWSLLDHFDSDGRRYYVAMRNEPKVGQLRALTRRERQVVAYAAMGHADKLIAYHLGLSRTTVSAHLASARRKLGVASRLSLIELAGDLAARQPVPADPDDSESTPE